jgi:glucuronoarabinoxylan endo-1,4-beta-xylanase
MMSFNFSSITRLCKYLLLFNVSLVTAQNVTVNLNSEQQLMRGFGGINHPTWYKDLNAQERDLAFGNGPGQLGLTILRTFVSDNKSEWSLGLATAQRAIELGAIVFASPWNPPASMTVTVNGKKRINPNSFADYAKHLNDYVEHMRSNGVELYAISTQNEPDYANEWTEWSPTESVNFIKGYRNLISCRLMTPESFQYKKNVYDPILNDPDALANVDIFGTHLYGTQLADFPYPLFQQKGKGKELWMTEVYTDSNNDANIWNLALNMAVHIHNALVEGRFQAYVWWPLRRYYALIHDGEGGHGGSNVAAAGTATKRGYVMAQFSKYIRNGYLRVDATKSPKSNVYVSAYKGKDSVVIVLVNSNSSSQTISISIPNTTVKTFSKITTSASKSLSDDGTVTVTDGSCSVTLDAQSITTLAGSGFKDPSEPKCPFNETPHEIPGRIEAEEYDKGGEGQSFHEADASGNQGLASFRNDEVDIEETTDSSGEYNICYTRKDEWLEYTIFVKTTGSYNLDLRIASDGDGKTLHIEMDSTILSGPVSIPNTGGRQNWATVTVNNINLTEGQHVIRLVFDSDYLNLNFMELQLATSLKGNRTAGGKMSPCFIDASRIRINGHFSYRITDMRGSVLETGNGVDELKYGKVLVPGVYLISVKNNAGKFSRMVLKNN